MSAQKEGKVKYITGLIAILAIFFLSSSGSYEKAAIQACIEAFPEADPASVRTLNSVCGLAQFITLTLLSPIIGRKLKYKTAAIMGAFCISVGGLVPIVFHPTWSVVLFFRCIIGVGTGFLGARNALMLRYVPQDEATRWIGFGAAAQNISGIVLPIISGALSDIAWNYSFLVNVCGPICLVIFLLFLREPADQNAVAPDTSEKAAEKKKFKIHPLFYLFFVIEIVVTLTLYPLLSGMSSYFKEFNLGTAAVAGTVLSTYTFGGLFANMTLNQSVKLFGKKFFAVNCLIVTVAQGLLVVWHSLIVAFIGAFFCGFGFYSVFSSLQVYNRRVQPTESLAFTSSLLQGGSQLALFMSSYFMILCARVVPGNGSDVIKTFIAATVCYAVLGVVFLVLDVIPEEKKAPSA